MTVRGSLFRKPEFMKIFLSHSSQQKLFVKHIQERKPDGIEFWVDEAKIRLGDDIEKKLISAISQQDLLMVIIDNEAAKSHWVRKEIEWALDHEKKLNRPFLLPVVIHLKAWKSLLGPAEATRKYLQCANFNDSTVKAFFESLFLELFEWLLRERERYAGASTQSLQTAPGQSVVGKLGAANALASSLVNTIRTLIHTHRRDTPLSIDALAAGLRALPDAAQIDRHGTLELLRSLADNNMLRGVSFDEHSIFLARETNSDKRALFTNAKAAIAATAVRMIKSGDRIGIDGGSTTLQIARRIAHELRAESLTDLDVFTNSVPVAHRLLETLSEMGAPDHDTRCRVTLTGGWCRPTSLTVISGSDSGSPQSVTPSPANLDIAFLGTNGLHGREGFGIAHAYEVPAKRALLEAARRRVVVTDPSKFEVKQDILFAGFDENLEILTAEVEEHADAIDLVKEMLEGTSSTITVVPNA